MEDEQVAVAADHKAGDEETSCSLPASAPPLDFPSLYLAEGSLHLPSFVAPFLLAETADQVVELLSLLDDPEELARDLGKFGRALRLLRRLQRTGMLDAVPLEQWVRIAAGLSRLLMGEAEEDGEDGDELEGYGQEEEGYDQEEGGYEDEEEGYEHEEGEYEEGDDGQDDDLGSGVDEEREGATSGAEEGHIAAGGSTREGRGGSRSRPRRFHVGIENSIGEDSGDEDGGRKPGGNVRLSTSQQIRVCDALDDVLDIIRSGYLPPLWMKPATSSRYAQSIAPSPAAGGWRSGLRLSRRGVYTPHSLASQRRVLPRSSEEETADEGPADRVGSEGEGSGCCHEAENSFVAEREEGSCLPHEGCSETQVEISEGGREGVAQTPLESLNKHLNWRWMLLQLLRRFDRSYRGQVASSTARRKALVTALVRLASACRPFWGFSPSSYAAHVSNTSTTLQPQASVPSPASSSAPLPSASQFLPRVSECRESNLASMVMHAVRHGTLFEALDLLVRTTSLTSTRLFLRFRLLLLFAPPSFCFSLVSDGRLTRLWGLVDGAFAPSWDALFVVLLFRACKYGWATGQPLTCRLRPLLPFLFQILLRVFQLPHSAPGVAASLKRQRETIPGEYTPLLENQFHTPSQVAKVFVLLLEPLPDALIGDEGRQTAERQGLGKAPVGREDSPETQAEKPEGMTAFKLLESLLSTLLVFTHPSSDGGRGAAAIGAFLNAFISAYIRRVQRERLGENVVSPACGRHRRSCCLGCSSSSSCLLSGTRATTAEARREKRRQSEEGHQDEKGEAEAGKRRAGPCECCWCTDGIEEAAGEFLCRRLGRREDEKVVQLLAPIFLQGMFSKHMAVASCYEDGMKLLCHLQPEKVIEGVLERAAASLETVTEANHTNTVQLLSRSAQTLVKFAPSALPTILSLTLPGLDPADPLKTFLTLSFYTVLFSYIPLIDCSGVSESVKRDFQGRLRQAYLPPQALTCSCSPAGSPCSSCSCLSSVSSREEGVVYGECASTLPEALAAARGPRHFMNLSNFPGSFLLQSDSEKDKMRPRGTHPSAHSASSSASSSSPSSLFVLSEERHGGRTSTGSVGLYRVQEDCWQQKILFDEEFFFTLISQREAASAVFPEWVDSWFEQILQLVKHAGKPSEKSGGPLARLDRGTTAILRACVTAVVCHVDEKVAARLVDKFLDWTETSFFGEAVKQAQSLAVPLAAAMPARMLEKLLGRVCEKLLTKDGAADLEKTHHPPQRRDPHTRDIEEATQSPSSSFVFPSSRLKSGLSETVILWHMRLVCSSVRSAGAEVLRFSSELFRLAHACFQHESKEVFKLGAKLLRRLLESSLGVYPWRLCSQRCMGPDEWREEARKNFVLRWGEPFWFQKGAEKIDWHVPSEAEAELATHAVSYGILVCKFLLKDVFPPLEPSSATASSASSLSSAVSSFSSLACAFSRAASAAPASAASGQVVERPTSSSEGAREERALTAREEERDAVGGKRRLAACRRREKPWHRPLEDFRAVAYPASFFSQSPEETASSPLARSSAPSFASRHSGTSTDFPTTCKKLGAAALLARALLLCRSLLKGCAVLYPDELPRQTRGVPVVSPFPLEDRRVFKSDMASVPSSVPSCLSTSVPGVDSLASSSSLGAKTDEGAAKGAEAAADVPDCVQKQGRSAEAEKVEGEKKERRDRGEQRGAAEDFAESLYGGGFRVGPLVEFAASLFLRIDRVFLRGEDRHPRGVQQERIGVDRHVDIEASVSSSASPSPPLSSSSRSCSSPVVSLGLEEAKLQKKLLRAARQLLVRTSAGTSLESFKSVRSGDADGKGGVAGKDAIGYLSCDSGVHAFSYLCDVPRGVWTQTVTSAWARRVAARRSEHAFQGWRRRVVLLIARLAAYHYAETRRVAQQVLREAFGVICGARRVVASLLLRELSEKCERQIRRDCEKADSASWLPSAPASLASPRPTVASPSVSSPPSRLASPLQSEGERAEKGGTDGRTSPALSVSGPPSERDSAVEAARPSSEASLASPATALLLRGDAREASRAASELSSSAASLEAVETPTEGKEDNRKPDTPQGRDPTPVSSPGDRTRLPAAPPAHENDAEDLFYAQLTGVAYTLNSESMARRVWGDAALAALALRTLLVVFQVKIGKDTVPQRWAALTHALLNCRESLRRRGAPFQRHLVKGVLLPLLTRLQQKSADAHPQLAPLADRQPSCHWRFSLVATCIAVCLNGPPVPEVLPEYSQWILQAIDSRLHPPLLNTVAMFALMLLLKYFLKHPEKDVPEPFLRSLHASTTLKKWIATQAIIHREGARPAGAGASAVRLAGTDSAYQLVVDVIKIDRSWPSSRTSRVSKALSLHNTLSAKTYFQFLFATRDRVDACVSSGGGHARGENGDMPESFSSLFQTLGEELLALSKHPSSEVEYHIAIVEIVSGAAAALRKQNDEEIRRELWKGLWPAMVAEYKQMDEVRLLAWLDAIRFAVQRPEKKFRVRRKASSTCVPSSCAAGEDAGGKRQSVPEDEQIRRILPFVNFCIHATTAAPQMDGLAAFPAFDEREFASSSFELTRQLRLYGGLLVAIMTESHLLSCSGSRASSRSSSLSSSAAREAEGNASPCTCLCRTCTAAAVIETGFPIIRKSLSHPYKQVREEVARLVSVIICLGNDEELLQIERERAFLEAQHLSGTAHRWPTPALCNRPGEEEKTPNAPQPGRQRGEGEEDAGRASESQLYRQHTCGCNVAKYRRELQALLLSHTAALAPGIDADTGPTGASQPGESKTPFLCGSATILTTCFYMLLQHDAGLLAACAAGGAHALDWCMHASAEFLAKSRARALTPEKVEGAGLASLSCVPSEPKAKEASEKLQAAAGARERETKEGNDRDSVEMHGLAGGPLMFLLVATKHPDRDIQTLATTVAKLLCLQPLQPQMLRDFSARKIGRGENRVEGREKAAREDVPEEAAETRERDTRAGEGCVSRREEGDVGDAFTSQLKALVEEPVTAQIHMLVEAFASYMRHPSWKVRCAAIRLSELLGCQYRMLLCGSKTYRRLVESGIAGLQDPQPEVQQAAKGALSFLLLSCTEQECRHYTQVFLEIAGPSTPAPHAAERRRLLAKDAGKHQSKENAHVRAVPSSPHPAAGASLSPPRNPLAGVLGLAALVHAAPFHVPDWLPETITCLAKYANAKMSDTIRRQVEKTLQEFYRTHQDAWQQLHVHKFSPEQLDVLDTYKGRPTYFA
uniref:Proteasome activator Blm10 mid region domain-containing protein n=1 Tax=Neospora caninum (strain Liverpool) TaxID=572307 RepID=A0A0F7UC36_NEOCL|nr:TPA: hypothetical protein BN1204_017880 [Neospora caninum Liverpool]